MYCEVEGQNIYFQKLGKGKDLILIHGWGADVSNFWPIIDYLKDSFTLWLLDLPGFGRSDLPKKQFAISDFAQIISGFIKKNNLKKPAVFGHSYGGKVSIKFASLYPNLIDKLILEGASGIRSQKTLLQILIFPVVKIANLLLPNIGNYQVIGNYRERIRTKLYKKLESDYKDAGNMKDIFVNTLKEDLTDDLKKIQVETLLIWGENDRAVPLKYGKKMYQLIKNSKLVVLENIGHFPHIKWPERVAYFVKDFSNN